MIKINKSLGTSTDFWFDIWQRQTLFKKGQHEFIIYWLGCLIRKKQQYFLQMDASKPGAVTL